jgi:hypothetical protein
MGALVVPLVMAGLLVSWGMQLCMLTAALAAVSRGQRPWPGGGTIHCLCSRWVGAAM